jgi:hypothetical protein
MLQNYGEIRKKSYSYHQKSPKQEELDNIDGTEIHKRNDHQNYIHM